VIKELRQKRGINQSQLAEILGLNMSTISSYERGKRQPSKKVLIKLSDIFEVSIEYLLRVSEEDEVDYLKSRQNELSEIIDLLKKKGFDPKNIIDKLSNQIPVLGRTGAGSSMLAVENPEDYLFSEDADFAVKVFGDSMEPIIIDKSMVFIRKMQQSSFRNGEIGLALVNHDESLVKRIYFTDKGVWLISDNKFYEPIFIEPEKWDAECKFLGKVVEVRYSI
jgi:repressor LexA